MECMSCFRKSLGLPLRGRPRLILVLQRMLDMSQVMIPVPGVDPDVFGKGNAPRVRVDEGPREQFFCQAF